MTGTRISLSPSLSYSFSLPLLPWRVQVATTCAALARRFIVHLRSFRLRKAVWYIPRHVRFINVNGRRDARCSQWPLSRRVSVSFFIYLIKGLFLNKIPLISFLSLFSLLLLLFFFFLILVVFAIFINTVVYTRNGDEWNVVTRDAFLIEEELLVGCSENFFYFNCSNFTVWQNW